MLFAYACGILDDCQQQKKTTKDELVPFCPLKFVEMKLPCVKRQVFMTLGNGWDVLVTL